MIRNSVVVTGVTSFLGYHIARTFAAADYGVIGTYCTPPQRLDSLRRTRWDRLQSSLTMCLPLDVTDADKVRDLIAAHRPQLWIHQAGLGKNFASVRYDIAEATRIGLLPLESIYENLAATGGALLATGSGMEYGTADCPHAEDGECLPESPYGLAKLTMTLRCRQLAHHYRVPTRIARVYTVLGELDAPDRLVARIFEQLCKGERIGVAPGVSRDVCDVADLAVGYLRIAADIARGPLFDIFNLSRGVAVPLFDLAKLAARQLQINPDLIFQDPAMVRAGESPAVYGDSRKALARLGWAARPVADGLLRLARGKSSISKSWLSLSETPSGVPRSSGSDNVRRCGTA